MTLPLLRSEAGLPIGVQLVGRRGNDARLLRTRAGLSKLWRRGGARRGRKPGAARSQEREGVMIMTLITGIIGIAMLVAFLGIMVWWVKALPLIIIVVGRARAADLRLRADAALRRERAPGAEATALMRILKFDVRASRSSRSSC